MYAVTLSKKRRSRRRGGQTIEIQTASISFEKKCSCWPLHLFDRLFSLKVLNTAERDGQLTSKLFTMIFWALIFLSHDIGG